MSDPAKAVFLSYAREDTDAARRIAEALRGFGVEVWFDMNELRGGDQWDAKIRTQIKSCALFIPIISSTTQSRDEGYFRLEWKLADDRSHLMAPGKAFIVPVVVDDTLDAGAAVPDSFGRAQWTRLAGGAPTPAFVEQVKRLLDAPGKSLEAGRPRPAQRDEGVASPRKAAVSSWMWAVATAVIVAVCVGVVLLRQPEPAAPPPAVAAAKPAAPSEISAQSVAVLAFANLSDDKGSEYFSDGISEELLNVLAKVPGLKVSARTSAFYFKGRNTPIPEIAKQLGVAYVVEGSVQRAGDRVKITAQLIKAADGFHLWSEAYTRDMKDIFAVQDEIAAKIATSLTDKLGMTLPASAKTTPEAYTLYLQARATLAKRGVPNLREAVGIFDKVISLDPDYLPARSGLAITLALIPAWSRSLALGESLEMITRAKREAQVVIERQPGNAEAWSALGLIYTSYDWRWQEAGEAIARSLALAPNDAEVVNFAGDHYRFVLADPQVVETEKRAIELNPLQSINHADLAVCYVALRQYELAIEPGRRSVSISPELVENYEILIRPYGFLKRFDDLRSVLEAARRIAPPRSAVLGNMEILAAIFEGRTADGLRLLEEFRPHVEQGGYSPAEYGFHYLRLGQPEKALPWLLLGVKGHDVGLVDPATVDLDLIAANPVTRVVLDDPGLKDLITVRARNARTAKAQR
jgi:TolB-like protein/Flp pilus assembly protein TadD